MNTTGSTLSVSASIHSTLSAGTLTDFENFAASNLNIQKKGLFRKKMSLKDVLSWQPEAIRCAPTYFYLNIRFIDLCYSYLRGGGDDLQVWGKQLLLGRPVYSRTKGEKIKMTKKEFLTVYFVTYPNWNGYLFC